MEDRISAAEERDTISILGKLHAALGLSPWQPLAGFPPTMENLEASVALLPDRREKLKRALRRTLNRSPNRDRRARRARRARRT